MLKDFLIGFLIFIVAISMSYNVGYFFQKGKNKADWEDKKI